MEQDYNYGVAKPSGKHFFRVFDTYPNEEQEWEDNGDKTYTAFVYGDCAWSVTSAMCGNTKDTISYYACVKKNHPEIFMGTNLWEQSKDCVIEVFSEEGGLMFSEHYLFDKGKRLIDECVEMKQVDENGKEITDYDNYDGDILYDNPNRRGLDEEFAWLI